MKMYQGKAAAKKKVLTLGDLPTKSVYEYVDKNKNWNRNRYAVLDQSCYSFCGQHKDGYKFVVDITTGKICHHRKMLAVVHVVDIDKKEEAVMDHFIGWKFGVPVRVFRRRGKLHILPNACLVHESARTFRVLSLRSGQVEPDILAPYTKEDYYYEPIPYKAPYGQHEPRYPVCQNNGYTAYCNQSKIMKNLGSVTGSLHPVPKPNPATLTIDGQTIKLSEETTRELKIKLGV